MAERWVWIATEVSLAAHPEQLAEHGGAEGLRDAGALRCTHRGCYTAERVGLRKRVKPNDARSCRARPSSANSARASPTALANLNPNPEQGLARLTRLLAG